MDRITRMDCLPMLTRLTRMIRLTRLTRMTLARGTRAPIHTRLTRMTSITTTTRHPILTTPNRMAIQNRLDRPTRMGRPRWLTILIMPTWPTRQTCLRRLTWITRMASRT